VVSHPHAIEVTVAQGRVGLRGPILDSELDPLIESLHGLRGVIGVDHQLEAHRRAGRIPALQGGRLRLEQSEFMQVSWSPSARLLAGATGGALVLYGLRRRGLSGAAIDLLGFGLLARGLTNLPLRDLVGHGDRRAISVQKTINIHAPVERVYEVWSHPENFPHFMSRVCEVTCTGDGRYRWTVLGPAGIPFTWEGNIIRQVPNEVIEFTSACGSAIDQHGVVRFDTNENGGTRVDVKMSYQPPAGAVGHVVAKLLGADPRSEMIADLMRMKSFIETGHQPHDATERRAAARAHVDAAGTPKPELA
jgi:uncharacterized membrane protein